MECFKIPTIKQGSQYCLAVFMNPQSYLHWDVTPVLSYRMHLLMPEKHNMVKPHQAVRPS